MDDAQTMLQLWDMAGREAVQPYQLMALMLKNAIIDDAKPLEWLPIKSFVSRAFSVKISVVGNNSCTIARAFGDYPTSWSRLDCPLKFLLEKPSNFWASESIFLRIGQSTRESEALNEVYGRIKSNGLNFRVVLPVQV